MDLAKIRKKSLRALKEPVNDGFTAPSSLPGLNTDTLEVIPADPVSPEADFLLKESHFTPAASSTVAAPSRAAMLPERVAATCTPLEAIMAGRAAAGCDDESILAEDSTNQIIDESCLEFLCFRVSDEIYGINIMDIKEIIKPREVTEVPRSPLFVSGVLSLRGIIIPIIDMRIRLKLAREAPTGKERIVVIRNSNSFSGLLVDEVIQVLKVQLDAVEAVPTVLDGIDRDFISGLGRSEGRLIIILNLENIADIDLC